MSVLLKQSIYSFFSVFILLFFIHVVHVLVSGLLLRFSGFEFDLMASGPTNMKYVRRPTNAEITAAFLLPWLVNLFIFLALAYLLSRRYFRPGGLARFLFNWGYVISFLYLFGHLLVGLVTNRGIGYITYYLNIELVFRLIISIVPLILLSVFSFRFSAKALLRFSTSSDQLEYGEFRRYVVAVVLLPALAAIALLVGAIYPANFYMYALAGVLILFISISAAATVRWLDLARPGIAAASLGAWPALLGICIGLAALLKAWTVIPL